MSIEFLELVRVTERRLHGLFVRLEQTSLTVFDCGIGALGTRAGKGDREMKAAALAPDIGSSTLTRPNQKTGMEPFFEFLNAVLYAFTQIRIEWTAYKSYQRNIPQGALL